MYITTEIINCVADIPSVLFSSYIFLQIKVPVKNCKIVRIIATAKIRSSCADNNDATESILMRKIVVLTTLLKFC